jgi:hypothetical protein
MERGAVRVMQLIPESLECTETYKTPDAFNYMDFMAQVSCYVKQKLVWGYLLVS